MASTINVTNIDTTYPIAGQDNDSQGFRDNFTNTNTNFIAAKAEIEDLQDNVVLKAPLTGGTVNNDFGGGLLLNAVIENFRGTVVNTGNVGATVQINVSAGPYHKIITQEIITAMTFTGWPPTGEVGIVQVEIFVSNLAHTVTLADTPPVWFGLDGVQTAVGNTITFLTTGKHILEFASTDNGATVSVNQLTVDLSAVSTGMNDLIDDTTPTLGGPLDVGGEIITSATAGDIVITPDTTGNIVLDGQIWPQAVGTLGYVLKQGAAGQLEWAAAGIVTELNDLSSNVTWANVPDGNITETSVTQHKVAVSKTDYNAQIADYTGVLADAEKMITMNLTGTANTFTIPANGGVAYPIGTKLNIMQLGTGVTTVAITTDNLRVNANFTLVLNGQYAVATALKVAADEWVLFGNLVAV